MFIGRTMWFVAGLLIAGSASGQFKPDPTAMVKDLDIVARSEKHMTVVMWMPTEFWRSTLESSGNLGAHELDQFTSELDPYVLIGGWTDGDTRLDELRGARVAEKRCNYRECTRNRC